MRFETARVVTLEIPFRAPLVGGAHRWQRRRLAIVSLGATPGLEGLGEVAVPAPAGLPEPIDEASVAGLVGVDLEDAASLDQAIRAIDAGPNATGALRGAVVSAIADLRARHAGVSIAADMVDGPRQSVRLNGLLGIDRPEATAAKAQRLVALGFGCLKLKAGPEPAGELVDRVAAVRAAAGAGVELRVDFNGTLDMSNAEATIEALAGFDIAYVEEPIAMWFGPTSLAALRRSVSVAIAADETVDGISSARELIDAEAVDVLVVKPARVGGLWPARRIAELAQDAGVPVVVSTLFETGVGIAGALQLAASLPHDLCHGLATADLLVSDLLAQPLGIRRGRMAMPDGAGLGIELDPAVVAKFRIA